MSCFMNAMLMLLSSQLSMPVDALRVQKINKTSAVGGKVVTLGDSYSSGAGIHSKMSDYEGGNCARDHRTTPGVKYAAAQGLEGINVACAGDEIPQAFQQFDALQAEYGGEAASGWPDSVFLFTIGGNDVKSFAGEAWPDILTSCIMSFYGGCHEEDRNQIGNWDEVQAQVTAFYKKVAQGASQARIRVLGYPRLLQRSWHCIPVPGLALGAADWADEQIDELNSRLRAAVAAAKSIAPNVDIEFVDVTNLMTRGACSTSSRHINAIVLDGFGISTAAFHPSQRGYDKYYDGLSSSLGMSVSSMSSPPVADEQWRVERILGGWDTDEDGKLSIGEVLHMGGPDASPKVSRQLRKLFRTADIDQDGFLSLKEFQTFLDLVADVESP